jgi:hypothetical protein
MGNGRMKLGNLEAWKLGSLETKPHIGETSPSIGGDREGGWMGKWKVNEISVNFF